MLEPLLPAATPGGRPRRGDVREIINAVRYLLRTGCAWRFLPHDFPQWQTVYAYGRQWAGDGTWEQIAATLRRDVRVALGRQPDPSAAILDRQRVKTTEQGGRGGPTRGSRSPVASATCLLIPRDS